MDKKLEIRMGELIDLAIGKDTYRSTIQEIDKGIVHAMQPVGKMNVPLRINQYEEIDLIYYRENCRYINKSIFLGRSRIDNIPIISLQLKGEPQRVQMRNSYRLPYKMPVVLRPIDPTLGLEEEYRSQSVDISETGLLVEFPKEVKIGTIFNVQFYLEMDDAFRVVVHATVCRLIEPANRESPWRLGLRFLDHTDDMRRAIARFILMVQISRRLDKNQP